MCLVIALAVIVVVQYRAVVNLVDTQRVLQHAAMESAAAGFRAELGSLSEIDVDGLPDRLSGLMDTVLTWSPSVLPDWPERFEPWRHYIETTLIPGVQYGSDMVVAEQSAVFSRGGIPAVVRPRMSIEEGSFNVSYEVVVFDMGTLRDSMLVSAISQHLGSLSDEFFVRIRLDDGSVLYSSDSLAASFPVVDGRFPLMDSIRRVSSLRMDGEFSLMAERTNQLGAEVVDGEAVLELVHRSGSLESARASTIHRQLILLFGLVGIIVATVVVLLILQRRAQRLADQQALFVAGISHELRTPISSVLALSDNLSAGHVTDPVDVAEYGRLLSEEGQRLSGMVQDVLDFATASAGTDDGFESFDVVPVIEHTLERARIRFPDVDMRLHLDEGLRGVRCHGREPALASAVMNLVTNACLHGEKDGPVDVSVSMKTGGTCRVDISDRGPGIPDSLDVLVKPFYRGKRATSMQIPGNGLGLGIVARVVAIHSGTLQARNRPGGGATFSMEIPVESRGTS